MNLFKLIDSFFSSVAMWAMKTVRFFGISQKKFIYLHIGVSWLLTVLVLSYDGGDVLWGVICTLATILSFVGIGKLIEEWERLNSGGVSERVRPSGMLWSIGFRLLLVALWTFTLVSSDIYEVTKWFYVVPLLFNGYSYLYFVLHYDIGTKSTFKGLVRVAVAKLKKLNSPERAPVPQPTS